MERESSLGSGAIIDGLKAELPVYMAIAEDVVIPNEEKKFEWWCGHDNQLPSRASVKQVFQPSFFRNILCYGRKSIFNTESALQ